MGENVRYQIPDPIYQERKRQIYEKRKRMIKERALTSPGILFLWYWYEEHPKEEMKPNGTEEEKKGIPERRITYCNWLSK